MYTTHKFRYACINMGWNSGDTEFTWSRGGGFAIKVDANFRA